MPTSSQNDNDRFQEEIQFLDRPEDSLAREYIETIEVCDAIRYAKNGARPPELSFEEIRKRADNVIKTKDPAFLFYCFVRREGRRHIRHKNGERLSILGVFLPILGLSICFESISGGILLILIGIGIFVFAAPSANSRGFVYWMGE